MARQSSFSQEKSPRAIDARPLSVLLLVVLWAGGGVVEGAESAAPQWLHALVGTSLPSHDPSTQAVLLFSETSVSVLSVDKIRTHVREAYAILRPEGRQHGTVSIYFSPQRKITALHGWCVPAQGRDYEVREKDAVDSWSPTQGGELFSDLRLRTLHIPASDPGNIVGYEYEVEEQPFFLQTAWFFQRSSPVRESRLTLQLPRGWEYRSSWLFYPEVKPTETDGSLTQWVVNDVKALRTEPAMPPPIGVAGQMIVSFFPSGGTARKNEFATWDDMGRWYFDLVKGQLVGSAPIRQRVLDLTSDKNGQLQKMQAIAGFVQRDVRYVAIELGIGGYQPHAAPDVFSHLYGDCKDKATLTHAMLNEIGIDSYLVLINTRRGSVTRQTPAHSGFNHAILAIRLGTEAKDPSLIAVTQHPRLGALLFFDPTSELTPFGQIWGRLQANWGLVVTPEGGELVELPQQPSTMNGVDRVGKLSLDPGGKLTGDVEELRRGDRASAERGRLRTVVKEADRIKPIEDVLAGSLSTFQIVKASLVNFERTDQPLGYRYSLESEKYAKNAGSSLLVRPRVLGTEASGVLETKEPRQYPFEFDGPSRDTDTFDIALPQGYEVDELPPPTNAEFSFGSYHSKTEARGQTLHYARSLEIRELSVPVSRVEDLRRFYRLIASDERNVAVLKPAVAGK
jgi:hypothetical protein